MIYLLADIIINITAKQLQQTFSYIVPPDLDVRIGSRVVVPFGPRREEGIVLNIRPEEAADRQFKLKPIISVLSGQTGFREEMIQTAFWISQYYLCSMADALRLFMIEKKGLVQQPIVKAGTVAPETSDEESVIDWLRIHRHADKKMVCHKFPEALVNHMLACKKLCIQNYIKNKIADKREDWLIFCHDDISGSLKRRPRQTALLTELKEKGSAPVAVWQQRGYGRELIHKLCLSGCARLEERESRTVDLTECLKADEPLQLTPEQARAVAAVRADKEGRTFVLHGVTGSGKTEVYMQLAQDVVRKGGQILVLVPEIALTGQIVRRFIRRFGNDVVVMHSQLSKGERRNNWLRMANGESHICIGARSAVFTAAPALGLIIVDEEHDSSYKQEESPRYHAVAVARKRAAYYHCPVILGSATPSIQDYYRTQTGEYTLLELTQRVGKRPLPAVQVVDMREELARGNRSVLSDALASLLEETLSKHQQAIILLNRRGFSTFVMCRKCGYVVKCDTCDVAMVYHKSQQRLRCHYCDAEKEIPQICPSCGSKYIKFFGTGTEKVEQQLHELFPDARIIRLDQDTTSRKNSSDRIIEAFRRHEYDILLGTQMVAKGHDFASVSAVGILAADSLLNLPAFWAGERTFQLLTQAAGRAGRSTIPGRVVMQTYAPDHYVITCASKQDYLSFYTKEIAYRQELQYPPFFTLLKITIIDEDEELLWRHGNDLAQILKSWTRDNNSNIVIIGPFADVIKKVRNKYRIVILIRGNDLSTIKDFIRSRAEFRRSGVILDVDSNG